MLINHHKDNEITFLIIFQQFKHHHMKRWSYATAIMLSLAGGTIMTGCIDNDEPYGIEQIRLATADLLKSKKAAVEAEAAAANAAAEVENQG